VRLRTRRRHSAQAPNALIEALRLLTVVFFAGLGYQVSHVLASDGHGSELGPFSGVGLGIIVGSGIGYVIGGVFGRTAATTANRTEAALRDVSADTLIAGGFGALAGGVLGAVFGWPLFLIPQTLIAVAMFGIVVVLLAYIGFRLGAAKRDGVLEVVGRRSGVAPRRQPPVAYHKVMDTSVAIDARIVDVVRAGFLHGRMVVIQPVLDELQRLADSADPMRRSRGRRGLEVLETLRREPFVDLVVAPDSQPDVEEVDAKLVRICLEDDLALLTLDTNLAKVAAVTGVRVLNLHALALALRPPVVVGEDVTVQVSKPGREPGQGVGYLDDGTMVVIERGRALVGKDVTVRVTSVVITANGRLVFAHVSSAQRNASSASA
jgi:uncharacterized protein YacL